ncbi:MAG TPA: BACON domain-containing protein [Bryobacteraceae bacterium]|nr:BACON domain-containing protein [Bryobacteraceae bacterium]
MVGSAFGMGLQAICCVLALFCISVGACFAADSARTPLTVHASATEVRLHWFERKPVVVERAIPNGGFQVLGIAPQGEFVDPVIDRHQTYIYRATSVLEPRTSSTITVGPPPAGFNTVAANPVQTGNSQNFGQFPCMILDQNGDPLLAYVWVNPSGNVNLNNSDTSIYFVSWNRSAASFRPPVKIAVTGNIAAWSAFYDFAYPLALARDTSNHTLGIAYRSYSANGGLAYLNVALSTDEGQTWSSQVVTSLSETVDFSSIDLALSGGAVYVTYYEGSLGPAELVTGTETTAAGTWSSQHFPQVTGYPGVVNQYSIAVDSNGVPAVALTRVPTGQSGPYPTYFWRPVANTLVQVLTDNGYGGNGYSNLNRYAVRLIFNGTEPYILYGGPRTANPNQNQYEWVAYSPTGADGTWTVTNVPANGGAANGDTIGSPFGIAVGSVGQLAVASSAAESYRAGCGNKSNTNLATTPNLSEWTVCDLGGAGGPTITSDQPVVRYGVDDALFVAFTEPDVGHALPQSVQLWAQYSNGTCSYSVASASQTIGPAAGTGSFVLNAGSGCSWVDSSQASWLTVTSAESGSGMATVTFSATANTSGAQRAGTVTVAGSRIPLRKPQPVRRWHTSPPGVWVSEGRRAPKR